MVQEANRTGDEGVGGPNGLPVVKPKPVPVKVVGKEGVALLVEYIARGDLVRCVIPLEDYNPASGTADRAALEAGLPWGIPWEGIKGVSLAVAKELRRCGIFTRVDLSKRLHVARAAAIKALVPPTMEALANFVKEDNT